MSAAHTPGPWCVRDLPTAQRYIGPSQDGGAPSVAFVLARVNVPDERLDADARLVAAAPELLAALERANRVLAELAHSSFITCDDYGSKDMLQRVKATHELAYASIAKATGSAK